MKKRTVKKIFQVIETSEMTIPGYGEYSEFIEVLIYTKPHILKGFEFHTKEFEFILKIAENWKIFEMRKVITNQAMR